jgi:hypothetical protein
MKKNVNVPMFGGSSEQIIFIVKTCCKPFFVDFTLCYSHWLLDVKWGLSGVEIEGCSSYLLWDEVVGFFFFFLYDPDVCVLMLQFCWARFLAGLGFELRASCKHSRHSSALVTPPVRLQFCFMRPDHVLAVLHWNELLPLKVFILVIRRRCWG